MKRCSHTRFPKNNNSRPVIKQVPRLHASPQCDKGTIAYFESVFDAVAKGNIVKFRGFGVFSPALGGASRAGGAPVVFTPDPEIEKFLLSKCPNLLVNRPILEKLRGIQVVIVPDKRGKPKRL